ncbi:uncharacterized protein K460DRAFT_288780 [Cucurbitaria berberidis CBS 394.84]|uniref:AAA+ ATPase domain-containing protein n=1 Tax=Cucurbitaria berberidis CBS 394.84 TaxID=1168544 RepID=A0A9P4GDW3_9PLEO|nr:uncharacterized protein K460DRAFT_288780 [Cucurbitaria berberidis CBS 394.84]KAF1843780.1 hypothetical protein K460DRAFT_288780 [Cucurbitaria berberidis CBS 394.84]
MTDNDQELQRYQAFLRPLEGENTQVKAGIDAAEEEFRNAPLVWWDVKQHMGQHGAGLGQFAVMGTELKEVEDKDPKPVLLNTNSPWSAFLCGSQGSGKSHTLSCMLENCLLDEPNIGKNPHPLAGLVFHYDRSRGSGVCEAAYLCTSVPTKVLVSASNYGRLKQQYEAMAKQYGGNIEVEALELHASHLDTERIKLLMAVGKEGEMPLYMNVLTNILRSIAIANGGTGSFDYKTFTDRLAESGFTDMQNGPLNLRLDLLESYVDVPPRPSTVRENRRTITKINARHKNRKPGQPDILRRPPGSLTIIDLTDPVVDPDSACALFDICLSIFISQTTCGKIIALDEAHNYMGDNSAAAAQFTERLLKTIREQRHQGARVVIATQEPSVNPRLLDLCNITMVHRCTSPAWFAVLKEHMAALDKKNQDAFEKIVRLRLGEALLFCPTAAMKLAVDKKSIVRMDTDIVKFRTRSRITADGGRSKLADSG